MKDSVAHFLMRHGKAFLLPSLCFMGAVLTLLLRGQICAAAPIYNFDDFEKRDWETFSQERDRNEKQYRDQIGISLEYLDPGAWYAAYDSERFRAITDQEKQHLETGYRGVKEVCADRHYDTCRDLLIEETEGEYPVSNRNFTDSYIAKINSVYFRNHALYRVSDRYEHPVYDVVFGIEKRGLGFSLLFYWEDNIQSPRENTLTADMLNTAFNAIVQQEPELRITDTNLLNYIGFYLYLTSKGPGDFIINALDDYKSFCAIKGLCIGILDAVDAIRNQRGALPETRIEPVEYNHKPGWRVTIQTISFCGFFDTRTLTVLQNGEIYLDNMAHITPSPYDIYCYTF